MVNRKHPVRWLAPRPLWSGGKAVPPPAPIRQPEILRFDSDEFMDELQALVRTCPQNLGQWAAEVETWRSPMRRPPAAASLDLTAPAAPCPAAAAEPRDAGDGGGYGGDGGDGDGDGGDEEMLKLYQPAHQRYYLVAASLVCRQRGLPDRRVDAGRRETVSFVVRRRTAEEGSAKSREQAFIVTPAGAHWQTLNDDQRLAPQAGEERLALSPVSFPCPRGGRRRLWVGLIPAARREAYLTAPSGSSESAGAGSPAAGSPAAGSPDPRSLLFQADVAEPWRILIERAAVVADAAKPDDDVDDPEKAETVRQEMIEAAREQIRTVSWYVLLDFARFLQQRLPKVWAVIAEENATELERQEEKLLYRALTGMPANPPWTASGTLAGALKGVSKYEDELAELGAGEELPGAWPDFLLPLADPEHPDLVPAASEKKEKERDEKIEALVDQVDALATRVVEALPARDSADSAGETLLSERNFKDRGDGVFTLRCVYERPACERFLPPVVSAATRPFRLAAFFDPDAPARPIRIPMPVDTTPAGLRKFMKNTGFMISDTLCGQIKAIRKVSFGRLVRSVLPWPFRKSLPKVGRTVPCGHPDDSFGMVCSLSIPIVTLTALILLIIMVALFDMFFRWLPFLFTCFKVPGFGGKGR